MKNKTFYFHFKERTQTSIKEFLKQKLKDSLHLKESPEIFQKIKIELNSKMTTHWETLIQTGDKITLHLPVTLLKKYKLPVTPQYSLEKKDILFEDDFILIIDKPSGFPSAETLDPTRDHAHAMAERYCQKKLILMHRLDVETSGCLLLSKKKQATIFLQKLFEKKKIQKTYIALTTHPTPSNEWEMKNYLKKENSRILKMQETHSGGDLAHTKFRIQEKKENYTIVEATPLTGRTHQIRVHMKQSHCPILGEKLYANEVHSRLCLHALTLKFPHPETENVITITSEFPDFFKNEKKSNT